MMFEKIFPKVHPEGYKFLIISLIITLIFCQYQAFLASFLFLLQFGSIIFLEIQKELL